MCKWIVLILLSGSIANASGYSLVDAKAAHESTVVSKKAVDAQYCQDELEEAERGIADCIHVGRFGFTIEYNIKLCPNIEKTLKDSGYTVERDSYFTNQLNISW